MFEICAECEKLALDSGRQWSFLQLRQKQKLTAVLLSRSNKKKRICHTAFCEQHDEDDKLSLNRSI